MLAAMPLTHIQAQTLTLAPGSPETYVVKEGDTLWDIASVFLQEPWRWPEIWQGNPEVQDPDLIYPGDVLQLIATADGPRIVMERTGRQVVRLSPTVRESPMVDMPAAKVANTRGAMIILIMRRKISVSRPK